MAFHRPWNTVTRILRRRAQLRRRPLLPGATVIIVNWNTLDVVIDTLQAVRALSPAGTRIRVIDNGSDDGSAAALDAQPGVDVTRLPFNVGHAVALDLALLTCRTEVAVLLDSDAVPLRNDWIATVVEPLRERDLVLFGSRSSRNFVHPMYMAVDVDAFARRSLTCAVHQHPGVTDDTKEWGVTAFDTAEWLSRMVAPHELDFLPTTANPVAGLPGMTVADAVYHHGGVTRATAGGFETDSYELWLTTLEAILPSDALAAVGSNWAE